MMRSKIDRKKAPKWLKEHDVKLNEQRIWLHQRQKFSNRNILLLLEVTENEIDKRMHAALSPN